MSNDTSVFPVALLENAVTRPNCISRRRSLRFHLSDEPMRCPFPINCLYSTCRRTLVPSRWLANSRLPSGETRIEPEKSSCRHVGNTESQLTITPFHRH